MPSSRTFALAALMMLALLPGARAAEPTIVQTETAYLIKFVDRSGCVFYRNGSAHDAAAAASHLREKYAAVDATGAVKTAELFIEKVASRSALTGLPYEVACVGHERGPVADWLREALVRYQANWAPRDSRDAR